MLKAWFRNVRNPRNLGDRCAMFIHFKAKHYAFGKFLGACVNHHLLQIEASQMAVVRCTNLQM